MFRKLGGWIDRIRGKTETERHYGREADRAADLFEDEEEVAPEDREPIEPNLELVDFEGASSDIAWMTFNHDTGEVIIQFLDHGRTDRVYTYEGMPYEEFEAIRDGTGPFPKNRFPYYQKAVSTGQRVNYYVRNDHRDDLYEYQRHS